MGTSLKEIGEIITSMVTELNSFKIGAYILENMLTANLKVEETLNGTIRKLILGIGLMARR